MVTICLQHIPNNINNKFKIYKDMIYTAINKNDAYIELSEGENKLLLPTSAVILVNDSSNLVSIKNTASRKTVALVREENE